MARVESDDIFADAGNTAQQDAHVTREGAWRKHMLADDDLLCSAHCQTQQRSARLSHSTPDKRSVPRVLDPPEPDWPKRPWQSSWRSAFPIAGPSVLTSIHARITEAGMHSGWRTRRVALITCVAPGTRTKGSWISAWRRSGGSESQRRCNDLAAETCNQSAREMLRSMPSTDQCGL
jgi:hypothetical protein